MENKKDDRMQAKSLEDALRNHLKSKPVSGELSDDALEQVTGGAVLSSAFYIAKCCRCGWQSCPFDNRGASDIEVVVRDHCSRNMDCPGDFEVYEFDSRSVMLE